MNTSTTYTQGLCKIAVFGMLCTDKTVTITENSWTSGTTTFDLLEDTSKNIALPTLTISPDLCYATVWSVFRLTDNQNMVTAAPTSFTFLDPNLIITHDVASFTKRFWFFEKSSTFYFKGTTETAAPTHSSQFQFTIDFQDACRTSTIIA